MLKLTVPLAPYQYWLTSRRIRGMDANALRQVLAQQSVDELGYAEKLANKIKRLGGTPTMQFDQFNSNSGCVYKAPPPSDPSNLNQVIHDILDAEACAIEVYSKLSEEYRITDIVTHEIFEEHLEDEIGDEEEWKKLGANM